jgi:hypothetical protein
MLDYTLMSSVIFLFPCIHCSCVEGPSYGFCHTIWQSEQDSRKESRNLFYSIKGVCLAILAQVEVYILSIVHEHGLRVNLLERNENRKPSLADK